MQQGNYSSTHEEEMEEDEMISFISNYSKTYLSYSWAGYFDLNECNIHGFKLLRIKAEKIIKKMCDQMVNCLDK